MPNPALCVCICVGGPHVINIILSYVVQCVLVCIDHRKIRSAAAVWRSKSWAGLNFGRLRCKLSAAASTTVESALHGVSVKLNGKHSIFHRQAHAHFECGDCKQIFNSVELSSSVKEICKLCEVQSYLFDLNWLLKYSLLKMSLSTYPYSFLFFQLHFFSVANCQIKKIPNILQVLLT